jgi:hypothetical protein
VIGRWGVILPEEHAKMSGLVNLRVDVLYWSMAIMDPGCLVETMTRPVRAIWMAVRLAMRDTTLLHLPHPGIRDALKFSIITCFNLLCYNIDGSRDHVHWMGINGDNDNEMSR